MTHTRAIQNFFPMSRVAPLAGLLLAACAAAPNDGDPVESADTTPESRPERIYGVEGTVTQGRTTEPLTSSQEVGVLWLNWEEEESLVRIEVTPADVIGSELPAAFDVSVLVPPSDEMLGTSLISYTEGGASELLVDRDRVGFGVVVVGPEGSLAALPESVPFIDFIGTSDASTGAALRDLTYVSPYTVRYVKGASDEGLTFRDINGVASPLEDMTLIDVRAWASAIDIGICRDQTMGSWWDEPEVIDCIGGSEDPNRGNECLYAYSQEHADELDALCGAAPDPVKSDFRNSPMLGEGDSLTLPIGETDIRSALTVGGFIFLG
jgi:hypothetical protein